MVPQRHGTQTVLTGLLDRSALYGVLAEIEALGLRHLPRDGPLALRDRALILFLPHAP